ncbi:MAG: gliding motility-associated C-terminal domain-containing protein [Bacteroidota bacterium]
MKSTPWDKLLFFSFIFHFSIPFQIDAQVPTCSSNVPFYQVDLTGNPAGSWISPAHSRNSNCCGTISPDRCTSFEIILDAAAVQINFEIVSGAIPTGSMFYQINCGPQSPVGQPICVSGAGPHHLTFCKPGNNQNTYRITSIPRPIYPGNVFTRRGCSKTLTVIGMKQSTITWTSVYPGTPGQYDFLLSCVSGCSTTVFVPTPLSPPLIQYRVCGTPAASICGLANECGIVTVATYENLTATVSPNPASFCAGGPGVLLTANAIGGDSAYDYTWTNSAGTTVSTTSTYNVMAVGTYTLEVRDGIYDTESCSGAFVSIPVTEIQPPAANAGIDQTVCYDLPSALLTGFASNYSFVNWSGGAGTFIPNDTILFVTYTPSAGEIAFGSATLTLTAIAQGGGCTNTIDSVTIKYNTEVVAFVPDQTLLCHEDTAVLTANVSGGSGAYIYSWNTGETTSSINAIGGNYSVTITDSIGCSQTSSASVSAPPLLTVSTTSTDATTNGGTDGTATAIPSGGTPPYTYIWSDLQNNQTALGLGFGIYSVTVTDINGCEASGSVLVNEPACSSFSANTSGADVSCNGLSNGTAIATASGGATPYTFQWNDNNSQVNDTAFNLSSGYYTVTITDNVNCLTVATQVISQPDVLANSISKVDVVLFGGNTGSATAYAIGGTQPYNYLWSTVPSQSDSTATGLSAGLYFVILTDANGCSLTDSVEINGPDCSNLAATINSIDVSCFGVNDGSANANGYFGTLPYTYLWSDSQTTQIATGLSPGSYDVMITDSLNCSSVATVYILEPSALAISVQKTDVTCNSFNNGSIDLAVSGGTFPYFFVWSNGSYTEDISLLAPDDYSVIVTDNKGCSNTISVNITEPPALTYSISKADVACFGDSIGNIDVNIYGGTLPYTYIWSNGETTEDITDLVSGQYFLIVTDSNGCQLTTIPDIIIDEPDSLEFLSVSVDCPVPGSTVATVTVSPFGGYGPYQISFDNGITFLTQGDYVEDLPVNSAYNVIILDSFMCSSAVPHSFFINPSVALYVSDVVFNPCFSAGTLDDTVIVSPSGGDGGPFSVSFNNGNTYQIPGDYDAVLPINSSYNIIVRDTSGCTSPTVNITLPDIFSASATIPGFAGGGNVSCNGSTNGYINLSVNGGASPYIYLWSTLETTEDIANLGAGVYSVTVTDTNSCQIDTGFTITEPSPLTASSTAGATSNSCFGDCNANAVASPSGGVMPYTFLWNNPLAQTDSLASGLCAGNYTVKVTDANGCEILSSVNIATPPAFSAMMATNNATCGACNGSASVSASGGTPGYIINWLDVSFNPIGQTDSNAASLCAGMYYVLVSDTNNCVDTFAIGVSNIGAEAVSTISGNTSCFSSCDGQIEANFVCNDPPCTVEWYELSSATLLGFSDSLATNLCSGVYSVHVANNSACLNVVIDTVTEPLPILHNATLSNSNCFGVNDGSIVVSPGGGSGSFIYLWSANAGSSTDSSVTGLSPGIYSVIITDSAACDTVYSFTITEPSAITVLKDSANASCKEVCDGTASVSVSGGVYPYMFLWDNGHIDSLADGLCDGAHFVKVTDDNGCVDSVLFNITEPEPLNSTLSVTDALCHNSCDGTATVLSSGGTAPYFYQWDSMAGGQSGSTATGLCAGTYNVIISDTNNCDTMIIISVSQPQTINASITTTDVICNSECNGTTTAFLSGGTAPYTYLWSDSLTQTGSTATGLCSDTFNVFISDANVCDTVFQAVVLQPQPLSVVVYENDALCSEDTSGFIALQVSGGNGFYTYLWSNGDTTATAVNLDTGTYSVMITDASGCDTVVYAVIAEPASLSANIFSDPSTCGVCNGSATVSVSGGTPGYTYEWVDAYFNPIPHSDTMASGLCEGLYSIYVFDTNICIDIFSFNISDIGAESVSLNISDEICFGACNGTALVTSSCLDPPCSYEWFDYSTGLTTGQTDSFATGLCPGIYFVETTNNSGCITIEGDTVNTGTQMLANLIVADESCFGMCNGMIELFPSGGQPGYTYLWDSLAGNSTDPVVTNLCPNTYSVTISDAAGCDTVHTFTIAEPVQIMLSFNNSFTSCNGSCDGYALVTPSGGVAPFNFNWNNGEVDSAAVALCAGVQVVTVTDAAGCAVSDSVTIDEPPSITIYYSVIDALCSGVPTGSIDLTVGGGTPGFSFLWSDSSTTEDISSLAGGTYLVIVTDTNNCSDTASIFVNENAHIILTLNGNDIDCYGNQNGSISASLTNGTAPFVFNWSNDDSTQNISGLGAGWYVLVVQDSNGCTSTDSIQITEPEILNVSVSSQILPNGYNISFYQGTDGIADASVSGGTGYFVYLWSNGANTASITGLSAGNYQLTVTDFNGCTGTDVVAITQPDALAMPTGYTPNGDGKNDYFVILGIDAYPENNLVAYNRWGNLVYEKENYQNEWKGENLSGKSIPDGTYYVILTIKDAGIALTGYVDIRR